MPLESGAGDDYGCSGDCANCQTPDCDDRKETYNEAYEAPAEEKKAGEGEASMQ
jgi:pyruvate-formate lyase-activating enzyme